MHQISFKEIRCKEIIIVLITIILIIMIAVIRLYLDFRRFVSLNLIYCLHFLMDYLLDYFVDLTLSNSSFNLLLRHQGQIIVKVIIVMSVYLEDCSNHLNLDFIIN
jgi:hypothetical protein